MTNKFGPPRDARKISGDLLFKSAWLIICQQLKTSITVSAYETSLVLGFVDVCHRRLGGGTG
jgi:hypothetical protein